MNSSKIREFFYPILEVKKLTVIFILYVVYLAFFAFWSVELIRMITDSVENKDLDKLYTLVIFFIFFIIFTFLIEFMWRKIYPTFYWTVKNIISKKYIKEFVLFENNVYEKIGTWKLIALIEKWIDTWKTLLSDFLYFWLNIIFTFTFSILYIYWIIWFYIIYIILFLIVLFCIAIFFNKKAIIEKSKIVDSDNNYTKYFVKVIMSKFEILQNDRIDKEIQNLEKINDEKTYYFIRRIFWVTLGFWTNLLFINLLKATMILIVWVWVIKWVYNFSDFVAIIAVLTLLDKNSSKAVEYYKNFTKDFVKVDKLFELFKNTPKIERYETWKKFIYKKWNIDINDLCFSYPWKKVFNKFNLEIKHSQKTAIIWKSGSGKTTLIKLITGFLQANSWTIKVDKQDLNKVSLKTYYKHIWYLTQEPSVFDWTIIENLTYWNKKKLSKKEIKDALKKAKADFVFDFPKWLDTEIWERWIRLSWWQRQRLAIAKIFIKNPEIIILDEPTSALDSFSEEAVSKAIHNLFVWRTVIIIAHRLQTVKEADDIIVFDDFEIIERWTHKELLKKWKYYKKMVDLQSGVLWK